jgi:hypothetical protein
MQISPFELRLMKTAAVYGSDIAEMLQLSQLDRLLPRSAARAMP